MHLYFYLPQPLQVSKVLQDNQENQAQWDHMDLLEKVV